MFGYIRPVERELKVREAEYYRAVYCGICLAEGRLCGQSARLTLSYDSVFIALLRSAVTGIQPQTKMRRCFLHPLCRRAAANADPSVDAAALSCVLLACGKLEDDISDEGFVRRTGAGAAKLFLSGAEKRAAARAPEISAGIKERLCELSCAEKDGTASIDIPAAMCGRMTGDAAAAGLEGSAARIVRAAADAAGRWLYCVDAADDLAEDMKRGRPNPIYRLYGKERLTREEALTFSCTVEAHLDAARAALELAPSEARATAPESWAICRNILDLGMPAAAAKAIEKITDGIAADAAGKEN